MARIEIPSIGITRTVVEGDEDDQLKRGMGHRETTPLPGQKGNSAISGHRTTYGQPLHNIDKIERGDLIHVETVQGEFTYEVTGHEIVEPHETRVLENRGRNELTLIACHPKYYLDQRYILYAELTNDAVGPLPGQEERLAEAAHDEGLLPNTRDGLSSGPSARTPIIVWFLACSVIWLATWVVQKELRKRLRAHDGSDHSSDLSMARRLIPWSPYLLGLPAFLVALYFFFESLSLLLPGTF